MNHYKLIVLFIAIIFFGCNKSKIDKVLYVNVDSTLLIREKPSPDSKILGQLKNNDAVDIIKYSDNYSIINNKSFPWAQIKFNNSHGWVFAGFLKHDINMHIVSELVSPNGKYYARQLTKDKEQKQCTEFYSQSTCSVIIIRCKDNSIISLFESTGIERWYDNDNILIRSQGAEAVGGFDEITKINIFTKNKTTLWSYSVGFSDSRPIIDPNDKTDYPDTGAIRIHNSIIYFNDYHNTEIIEIFSDEEKKILLNRFNAKSITPIESLDFVKFKVDKTIYVYKNGKIETISK